MIRSAMAVLALVILSGFVVPTPLRAQQEAAPQEARTHEVREGDTLWKIAVRYYDSGWLWTRILEANRDRIDDPESLDVGLVLAIPPAGDAEDAGEPAEVGEVVVEGPPDEPEDPVEGAEEKAVEEAAEAMERMEQAATPQEAPRGPKPIRRRTAFYPDTTNPTIATESAPKLFAVSRDVVFSAPWLARRGMSPGALGEVVGFAGSEGEVTHRVSVRPHDRLLVTFEGPVPAVGSLLQVYRVDQELPEVGEVVKPTGVVRIDAIEPAGAVAEVTKIYDRMALGDLLGPLPPYDLVEGQKAENVQDGPVTAILGFATSRPIHSIGDVVFLDLGEASGVGIGDEFHVVFSSGEGWTGVAEGRLQVIGVHEDHSVARISAEESPVFTRSIRVRLDRRMR